MEIILPVLEMVLISCVQWTFLIIACVRKLRAGWKPTWRTLWYVLGFPFQGCFTQRQEEVSEEHLAARLHERRRDFTEGMFSIWTRACGTYSTISVLRHVLGFPMVGNVVINTLYLLMYLSGLLFNLFPIVFEKHLLLFMQGWFQVLLFCWGANLAIWHKTLYEHWKIGSILIRIALGIANPMQAANAFWSVAWAVLGILARDVDVPMSSVIADEMLIAIFTIFVVSKFEEIQTAQVRSDIKASGYLRAKKTMERLLADMCDAVVELDPELCIRQACPKLAGLLLKDVGNTALRGDSFPGLVLSEEDRDRFSNFVTQRAVPMAHEQKIEGDRRGSSMYMNLKDSIGTPVSVQVFHSCHLDDFDQLCHVVGVHEVDNNTEGARDTLGAGNWREGVERQPVLRSSHTEDARETVSEVGQQGESGVDSESVASSAVSYFAGSEASGISVHTVQSKLGRFHRRLRRLQVLAGEGDPGCVGMGAVV